MTTLTTTRARETEAVGAAIGPLLRVGEIAVLSGDLGSGETTFTTDLARWLGLDDGAVRVGFVHYNAVEAVERLLAELARLT